MKKQEISAQAVVDVEMAAVDTLSADLAAVVAPQNELNQAFENDKKIDEELELSQAKGEAVQVASADNGVAAMLLTDTNQAASGAAVGGGGAAASAAISTNAFLIAGAVAVAAVAVVASDDDESAAPVATTPVDPDPVDPEPVDSVPVVSGNQSLSLVQGKSAVITVTATDADGDQLAFSPSNPANGTLNTTSQPGQFTYTADESFIGIDSFTVTVSDEDNNSITRTITIDVTKATVTVTELTAGEDQVLGGPEANVIDAKFPNNVSTLSASDNIDGGDGEDTLNIYSDGDNSINSAVPASAVITDVEIINIFNTTDIALGTNLFDASNYDGVTALNQIGADAGDVKNLLATTTAGFTSTVGARIVSAEAAATSATVNLSDVVAATFNLAVNGDALSSLTITGATTPIAAPGPINLAVTVGKNVESLTVSTAVDVTLTVNSNSVAPDPKAVTSVDASASTGDVDYVTGGSVANVTTGTGDDDVTLQTFTQDTVGAIINASVDTGAGDDEINVATDGTGDTTVNLGDGDNELTATGYTATGLLTITGGSGVDTIDATAGKAISELNLSTGDSNDVISGITLVDGIVIDGGDGIDSLTIVSGGGAIFVAEYDVLDDDVSNVEQLVFGTTANTVTVDGSELKADFTQLTFTGEVGSTGHLAANITATQKIVASQIGVTATAATAAIPVRVLNIEAIADGTDRSEIVATADEVNLTVSTASATNNDAVLEGVFASANIALASSVTVVANVATDNVATITIDTAAGATALTDLVITGEGSATVDNDGNTLTTVDASGLSNTLVTGKIDSGLDYTAGASVETISLGGGKDVLTFGLPASTYGDMDTVIGFDAVQEDLQAAGTSTTDSIIFGGLTLNGDPAAGGTDVGTKVTLGGNTDSLFEAFKDAASENDGFVVSFFHFGGNTYLFQNDVPLAVGLRDLESADLALKVTGIVDFADDFAVNV